MHNIELTLEEAVHLDQILWSWHFEFDKEGQTDPVNSSLHAKMLTILQQYTEEELQVPLLAYEDRIRRVDE